MSDGKCPPLILKKKRVRNCSEALELSIRRYNLPVWSRMTVGADGVGVGDGDSPRVSGTAASAAGVAIVKDGADDEVGEGGGG